MKFLISWLHRDIAIQENWMIHYEIWLIKKKSLKKFNESGKYSEIKITEILRLAWFT